jgi:hypothetical protein
MTYKDRQLLLDAMVAEAPEVILREIAEDASHTLRLLEPIINAALAKAYDQGRMQTWLEIAYANYCRTDKCPACGSLNVGAECFDFGTCRETGYQDAGILGLCHDCGHSGDHQDFEP